MSRFRNSRPAYAVDGVEPDHGSNGWDYYDGESLAEQPSLVDAVTRLPKDPALDELADCLSVGTRDGRQWSLGFEDAMLAVFDLSRPGTDVFEQALAAAPWTESVERVDREAFLFTTAETLTADVVLANVLDVCGEVFRRLNGPST